MKLGDKIVDNEEYSVVIVDDEEMVTTAIGTLFMLENPEYDVLIFNSPSEALEELKRLEAARVVAGQHVLAHAADRDRWKGEEQRLNRLVKHWHTLYVRACRKYDEDTSPRFNDGTME